MGPYYSHVEADKKTWAEHTLSYDSTVRKDSRRRIANFVNGEKLYLGYKEKACGGLTFQHWIVTNTKWHLEFGDSNKDIYSARVNINNHVYENYMYVKETEMNEEIRMRMEHVLGMNNYSLCLRNCEHVANYVFRGRWISHQMDSQNNETRVLMKAVILAKMTESDRQKVNTFPASIRPHVIGKNCPKMYSFITDHPVVNRFDYYLDWNENTYNILMVGPTGAGKSHLINTFFNQKICDSDTSHTSVTKEIYFIRGVGDVYNPAIKKYERRQILVADTIGLCDTEWDEDKVIKSIKGRVNANYKYVDAVFVVFRADRLMKCIVDSIKKILKWLNYDKNTSRRFVFVATHSDYLSDDKILELKKEATAILNLYQTSGYRILDGRPIDFLVYTGFAPEAYLNDLAKKRVLDSWDNILSVMKNPLLSEEEIKTGKMVRLDLKRQFDCTIL